MRKITAMLIVPVMKLTGFRFTKDYRHGSTLFHRVVYFAVDTVGANQKAGLPRMASRLEG